MFYVISWHTIRERSGKTKNETRVSQRHPEAERERERENRMIARARASVIGAADRLIRKRRQASELRGARGGGFSVL